MKIARKFVDAFEKAESMGPRAVSLAASLALTGLVPAHAQFVLLEDFEGHSLGAALDADAGWTSQAGANPATGGTIIEDGGSQAAWILGGSNNGGYYTGLGAQTISEGTTGTVFFRFRSENSIAVPAGDWLQVAAFVTDWQPDSNVWWTHDEAGFYSRWNTVADGTGIIPHWDDLGGAGTTDIFGSTWYNVWIVADNTAKTYGLYLSQGTDGATGGASSVTAGTNIPFRNSTGDLDFLYFADTDGNATTGVVIDDIHVDPTSANLAHPAVAISGLFWDGTDLDGDANGGSGTWDVGTSANWDDLPEGGADKTWTQGEDAFLGGAAAGTVTLSQPITVGKLTFDLPGYHLSGTTLTVADSIMALQDATISSALAGNSPLSKTGAGTLTLNGNSLGFTGPFTVAGGRLNLDGDLGASVTVNDGITLGGEGSTTGDLQLGSTGGTGATLAVDVDTSSALIADNLTLEGVTSLVLEGTIPFGTPIPIVSYGGTLTDNSGGATLADAFAPPTALRKTVTVDSSTLNTLQLTLGAPESITWTNAAATGFWSVGNAFGDGNWTSTDTFFYSGDAVTFADTAPGIVALDASEGTLEPASVTFSNTAGNGYTITGAPISGSGSLLVDGGGTVVLEQNNRFTGGTTVDNGTLKLAELVNDGTGVLVGTVTVNGGGTLLASEVNVFGWTNESSKINTLNINGGAVHSTVGAPNPGPDNGWNIEINMTGGELGNMGDGIGYFSLGGYVGGGSAINTLASVDTALISANLVLRENNTDGALVGQLPITVADGAASPDLEVSGNIVAQGAGRGLTKLGAGAMLLSGINTWNGPTLASEGCLILNDILAIPGLADVTVAAGAGFGGIVGASNLVDSDIRDVVDLVAWDASGDSFLVLDTNGANVTVGADIVGNFKLKKKGAGDLTLTGTVAVNDTVIEGGSVIIAGGSVTIDSITTGPGTNSGKMVTIAFTATGKVDVFASDDLQDWGAAIATGVAASPFVEDDVTDGKRFYRFNPTP
jgi:fibronectin-binding autotransporter adhesin